MVINDELDMLHILQAQEVKAEIPDEGFPAPRNNAEEEEEAPMPTGIADMRMQIEADDAAAEREARRINEIILQEGPPLKKRKIRGDGGGGGGSRAESEKREPKAPLTTFGHSSRPRRSVNYASIEKGEEAQSQSLVTEFTQRKRQKKTRDELDENYVEGSEVDGQKRRRPVAAAARSSLATSSGATSSSAFYNSPTSTMATGRALVEKSAVEEYMEVVPRPADARPVHSNFSTSLEKHAGVRRASGGFRKYVAWLTDEQVARLLTLVQERCKVAGRDTVIQTIRHVYNSLPASYRRGWERAARMDVFESRKFVTDLAMPLSEIQLKDPERPLLHTRINEVQANCCALRPRFSEMPHTIAHYLKHHDVVHLFGCDFCSKVFASRYELTKHDCKDFAEHMYRLTLKQETLTLEAAYMYLCCVQCGLWLSVKATLAGAKGWPYFATAIRSHSCQALVPIVAFFIKPLDSRVKRVRMTFQMMSTLDVGFPTCCVECETADFESVAAAEEHFKTKHEKSYQCGKCKMTFGTEFMYRHHIESHVTPSAQMAHYLLYGATFRPPPNSGRLPHVGFASEVPAIGGLVAGEMQTYEALEKKNKEFVQPFEDTLRKKVVRWKKAKKTGKKKTSSSNGGGPREFQREPGESSGEEEFQRRLRERGEDSSSSSSDYSSDSDAVTTNRRKRKKEIEIRGDLGYEHIDRTEMFARCEEEKEARRLLDKMHNRTMLLTREKLLEPREALEILRESRRMELPPQQCSLADDIALKTMRQVTMPLWNCIDPLKDNLLVNKIYVYCPKCEAVHNNDVKGHAQECQVDEDTLIEVYHCAAGPHAGVRCIVPECQTHLCSVLALRTHLADVHKKVVAIPKSIEEKATPSPPAAEDEPERYDGSIMAMAKLFERLQTDRRSDLAKMTDSDCRLPFGGFLDGKPHKTKFYTQKVLVPPERHLEAAAGAPATRSPPPPYPTPHHTRIKPYKLPRNTRWYQCILCAQQIHQLEYFVDHLIKEHMYPCTACGRIYNTKSLRRVHVCTLNYPDARAPGTQLTGVCCSCGEVANVESLSQHMYHRHFSTIEYIKETGQVMPMMQDVRVRQQPMPRTLVPNRVAISVPKIGGGVTGDPIPLRQQKIIPNSAPVLGVDLKTLSLREPPPNSFEYHPPEPHNLDTRLMCFLCELTFGDVDELTAHLDEHPEKWQRCPFCERLVMDHFDLQKHMLSAHVVNISGVMCCAFCHESHRYMCSHLLFRCTRIAKCSICGQKSANDALNRSHMSRCHSQSLRRFQCAYCPKVFISVGEYYEHRCPAVGNRVYWCTCSPQRFFTSANVFCDHYDTMHVQQNVCKLCGFHGHSMQDLVGHRGVHMKSGMPKTPKRQIFILNRILAPKNTSSYARFMSRNGGAPSSYQNVDRTGEYHLMGSVDPRSSAAAPPAPRTLFEALEGPNAISKLPSGSTQRNVTLQVRSRAPQQPSTSAAAAAADCIELSDEEMMEAEPQRPTQVDREVRVEVTQDGYKTANKHPGYVVEADEPEVEGAELSAEPVVKEVIDENGDDELAVVAEVEHTSGTLPSTIAASTGREKKYKCTKCSSAFITENSLRTHVSQDHKMDAGDTICSETYGVPVRLREGWLCRNCSVVFEDQKKHHRHMAIHGDTTHTCAFCCGISFNQSALANHARGHTEKRIFFACGTCQIKFLTDAHLMEHLSSAKHNQKLFFFCKVCALGSSDADHLFNHIQIHAGHPYTISQRFGAVPVQLLNFDPKDEQEFKIKVLQKATQLHVPSDCSHRSMLAQTDTLVSCKTCHCYQPWYNYMACNRYTEETGFPPFPVMDVAVEPFPLISQLTGQQAQMMLRYGNHKGAVPMLPQHHNIMSQPLRHPHPTTTGLPPPPYINQRRMVAPQWMNDSGRVGMPMSNGSRVNLPPTIGQQQQQQRSPPSGAQRRFVMNSNGRTVNVLPTQAPLQLPNRQVIGAARNHVAVTTKCQFRECNKMIFSEFDRDLHSMHESTTTWFCRQCGDSKTSERHLFLHYIKEHLTPAFQKQQSAGFIPYILQLKCPFPTCPHHLPQNAFQSPKVFEKHIRAAHAAELPFESACCDARFVTKELCRQHERSHQQRRDGLDDACCAICGSLHMWTMVKDPRTDCLQSHTIRHGLDYRSSCRQCLRQFPADVNQDLAVEHIREEHARLRDGGIVCQLCGEMGMDEEAFGAHCRQKHIFNILVKSAKSQRGELVVSTGEEYENYAGLKITRNMRAARVASSAASAASVAAHQHHQPSTSRPSATPSTSSGGNAALLNIAQAIEGIGGPAPAARRPPPPPPAEIYTIDSD